MSFRVLIEIIECCWSTLSELKDQKAPLFGELLCCIGTTFAIFDTV